MISTSADASSYLHSNIEELRGRNDPEAMKQVSMEMEALFAYEMIKAMRATVTHASDKALGSETYMSMFDMELARLFAEKGLGLKEMLLRGIGRGVKPAEGHSEGNVSAGATDLKRMNLKGSDGHMVLEAVKAGPEAHDPDNELGENKDSYSGRRAALPVEGRVSSGFGMRKHPVYGDHRFHHGIDIAAPEGSDIHPVRGGKVVFSGEQPGYGNVVIIDHGDGVLSKYGHNEANLIKEGDVVGTGTVIARVGSTGVSTGPHLHFEVMQNGLYIDPATVVAMR